MSLLSNQNPYQRVVFCDFDGTITAVETFVGMLKTFIPELASQVLPKLYARELTLREGVRQMIESIPSQNYTNIITFANTQEMRPGLPELLDCLEHYQVPFIIISAGIKEMIINFLIERNLLTRVKAVAGSELDYSGENLRIYSPFEDDTELVSKVKVMANYPARETIAIGDSITDLNMALKADLVFARDHLIDYLEKENKPYIPWENFLDIRDYLAQHWQ